MRDDTAPGFAAYEVEHTAIIECYEQMSEVFTPERANRVLKPEVWRDWSGRLDVAMVSEGKDQLHRMAKLGTLWAVFECIAGGCDVDRVMVSVHHKSPGSEDMYYQIGCRLAD